MEDHDWCDSEFIGTGDQSAGTPLSSVVSSLLKRSTLLLNEDSLFNILNHIDWFVSESQGNEIVEVVFLHPYAFNGFDNDAWDKVGLAVGNLQVLDKLYITNDYGDLHEPPVYPDWGELARILSQLRQNVTLDLDTEPFWSAGEVQALAQAIRGHPTIISFDSDHYLPYESLDSLFVIFGVGNIASSGSGKTFCNPR
jgi:hypothetical protein